MTTLTQTLTDYSGYVGPPSNTPDPTYPMWMYLWFPVANPYTTILLLQKIVRNGAEYNALAAQVVGDNS
jgi:hypothetical protein